MLNPLSATIVMLVVALGVLLFEHTRPGTTKSDEALTQAFKEDLLVYQLATSYRPPKEEPPAPEIKPDDPVPDEQPAKPESAGKEQKPAEQVAPSIPEYTQPVPVQPRAPTRRFFFRRGLSHELSDENLNPYLRHASQSAHLWDY